MSNKYMGTLVEFKEVSKSFNNKPLLDNINFKLEKGQITTLLGQNGAGKTTIAKLVLGIEKPSSGQVFVKNNIKIGYVPQKLEYGMNMPITSEGLLKILSPNYLDEQILNLIDFADYEKIQHIDISKISGGQLQKIMLVGTLMNEPDIIILDEPTQFLDVTSQQKFYKTLGTLKKDIGLTVFMISHDLFTVMRNSDQVICLNGHVCCSGRPIDLDNDPHLKNALSEIGLYVHEHDHKHLP